MRLLQRRTKVIDQLRRLWRQWLAAYQEPELPYLDEDPATLLTRLHHGTPRERWQAAAALGRLKPDVSHVSHLCRVLSDPEPFVRWEASRALVALGPALSLHPLLAVVEKGGPVAQAAAIEALGQLGRPEAIDVLTRAATGHSNVAVRVTAVGALGRLYANIRARTAEDPSVTTGLHRVLSALLQTGLSYHPALRRMTAVALRHFDDPRAERMLIELQLPQQPRPVREAATQSPP